MHPVRSRCQTLLPGGRPLRPVALYLTGAAVSGLAFSLPLTIYGLYAVREAGLGPMQLVLAGTALELSALVAEVPTGVVADAYSRRLSLIAGWAVTGLAFALMGAVPSFLFLLLGQVVWGVGWALTSGAREAWLADEVGEAAAAPVYVRAAQVQSAARLAGIPLGVAVAAFDPQAAFLAGGAISVALAVFLALTMTEEGYRPQPSPTAASRYAPMVESARAGLRTVRGSAVLVGVLAVALLGGMASEALDRLWPLHLLDAFTLPPVAGLGEVGWFGAIEAASLLGGIAATWLAGRATRAGDAQSLVRALVAITVALMVAVVAFALAGAFWIALLALVATRWVRIAQLPLMLAWLNRGLDPRSRATVISMLGQADSLGQVAGGPALGALAAARGVRAALVAVALVLAPTLPIYARASRLHAREAQEEQEEQDAEPAPGEAVAD